MLSIPKNIRKVDTTAGRDELRFLKILRRLVFLGGGGSRKKGTFLFKVVGRAIALWFQLRGSCTHS